jgi:hypothetical protein
VSGKEPATPDRGVAVTHGQWEGPRNRGSGSRPRPLPPWLGVRSEKAAHRIAVGCGDGGGRREGVYVPRRDASSRVNALAGGRLFPEVHGHAGFEAREKGGRFRVALDGDNGRRQLAVEGVVASELPASSAFRFLSEASEFFRRGSLGYSATAGSGQLDGLELQALDWRGQRLAVTAVESS